MSPCCESRKAVDTQLLLIAKRLPTKLMHDHPDLLEPLSRALTRFAKKLRISMDRIMGTREWCLLTLHSRDNQPILFAELENLLQQSKALSGLNPRQRSAARSELKTMLGDDLSIDANGVCKLSVTGLAEAKSRCCVPISDRQSRLRDYCVLLASRICMRLRLDSVTSRCISFRRELDKFYARIGVDTENAKSVRKWLIDHFRERPKPPSKYCTARDRSAPHLAFLLACLDVLR